MNYKFIDKQYKPCLQTVSREEKRNHTLCFQGNIRHVLFSFLLPLLTASEFLDYSNVLDHL